MAENAIQQYEVPPGSLIDVAANRLCLMARTNKAPAQMTFLGVLVTALPGATGSDVTAAWWEEYNRRNDAEQNVPEADALEQQAKILRQEARERASQPVIGYLAIPE